MAHIDRKDIPSGIRKALTTFNFVLVEVGSTNPFMTAVLESNEMWNRCLSKKASERIYTHSTAQHNWCFTENEYPTFIKCIYVCMVWGVERLGPLAHLTYYQRQLDRSLQQAYRLCPHCIEQEGTETQFLS